MAAEMFSAGFASCAEFAQDGFETIVSYQPLVEKSMFAEQVPYVTPLFEVSCHALCTVVVCAILLSCSLHCCAVCVK